MDDVTINDIKRAALEILSRRDHATYELQSKLFQKFDAGHEHIGTVLAELNQLNYLNDQRFSQLYCSYRSKKGFGPNRIQQELNHKLSPSGSTSHCIEVALSGPDSPDWFSLAKHTYFKKFKVPPQNFKERQKHKQFLYYRGFNQEEIEYALSVD